jgi:hypothetical protein
VEAVAAVAAVEAAVVVGSPGVVLLLPEASLEAGRVALLAVVAPVSEARQALEAVAPAPAARAVSVR